MILSDSDIQDYQEFRSAKNPLIYTNNPKENIFIGPSSVDLTLSNSFNSIKKTNLITFDTQIEYKEKIYTHFLLQAGEFVLASTQESINLPDNISAFVQGRSSIGRLGLQIQNAGFIDAGFSGQLTLELHNQGSSPILLEAGKRICQIVFILQSSPSLKVYNGKYQNQTGATGSKIHLDSSFSKKHGDVEYG